MSVSSPTADRADVTSAPVTRRVLLSPRWRRVFLLALLIVPLVGALAVAGYRYQDKVKSIFQPSIPAATPRAPEIVGLDAHGMVTVAPRSPLENKLKIMTVDS